MKITYFRSSCVCISNVTNIIRACPYAHAWNVYQQRVLHCYCCSGQTVSVELILWRAPWPSLTWVNMEQRRNDIGKGKPNDTKKNIFQCHSVYIKSHMDLKRDLCGAPTTNSLSDGNAFPFLGRWSNSLMGKRDWQGKDIFSNDVENVQSDMQKKKIRYCSTVPRITSYFDTIKMRI